MTVDMTDRIEKTKFLKAPRSRVWRALTTPAELGQWFGVALDTVRHSGPDNASACR